MLAVDSAIASIRPMNRGCTFSTSFKKTGMIGYAISVERSVNILTKPSESMFLPSHLIFFAGICRTQLVNKEVDEYCIDLAINKGCLILAIPARIFGFVDANCYDGSLSAARTVADTVHLKATRY